MTSTFVTANGIRLHYLDYPGGEPPLLLLHGLTANAYSFAPIIEAGLAPRFRVLALDLRGRGQSDKPATGYGMEDHAADVIGLLDSLGLEQVVLGGHSFGAWLTIYTAVHHPHRVRQAILVDAAARLHPNLRQLVQPSLDRLGTVVPSWEQYIAAVRKMPHWGGLWTEGIERHYAADVVVNSDGSVRSRSSAENIAEAADKAIAVDWLRLVAQMTQPTLLLNAPGAFGGPGAPPVLPSERALETVELLPAGTYVEIPGNHLTMLFGEGARPMAEAILAFVAA